MGQASGYLLNVGRYDVVAFLFVGCVCGGNAQIFVQLLYRGDVLCI